LGLDASAGRDLCQVKAINGRTLGLPALDRPPIRVSQDEIAGWIGPAEAPRSPLRTPRGRNKFVEMEKLHEKHQAERDGDQQSVSTGH